MVAGVLLIPKFATECAARFCEFSESGHSRWFSRVLVGRRYGAVCRTRTQSTRAGARFGRIPNTPYRQSCPGCRSRKKVGVRDQRYDKMPPLAEVVDPSEPCSEVSVR